MNNQTNWYKTFFNGLALAFWSKAITPAYTEAEIKFIKEIINLPANAAILDVPCGNGRHSMALAKEGHHVTGIDIAEEYIQQLKEAANGLQLPMMAIQADILEYNLSGEYDAALCLGNSFSYFPFQSMLIFVKKIHAALKQGGVFLIHTGALAESILPSIDEKDWMEIDDILFLSERIYHAAESTLQSNYRIVQKNKVENKTAYHYVFTLAEIRRLLAEAGFCSIEPYSDFTKSPFQLGDKQAYIVAKKNEIVTKHHDNTGLS